MPSRQRTFDLVPTALARSNGPRPPMTSKAAKKAYQEANRLPRISRAEQRRLDAEEIARQKKDYEKERAAVRAKAVREKKAAKADAERDARRKMGLPEPSKFVRASQPTISRFVRGKNNKRSWQEMESAADDSEDTLCEMGIEGEDQTREKAQAPSPTDSEDEFGDFPSLSQSDLLLEQTDEPLKKIREVGTIIPPPLAPAPNQSPISNQDDDKQDLPTWIITGADEYPFDDYQILADMATTQLLSEAAEAATRSDEASATPAKDRQLHCYASSSLVAAKSESPSKLLDSIKQSRLGPAEPQQSFRHPLQERSSNIPAAHLPSQTRKSISFAPMPPKPCRPSVNGRKHFLMPQPNITPSATQAFLENHLDDFFPSPTQEIRELLDDLDDLPSNTQVAKELNISKSADNQSFADLILSQDFILSSQDLLEITTRGRDSAEPEEPRLAPRVAHCAKPLFFEEKEDDLVHAAIHESRILAGAQDELKIQLNDSSMNSGRRTLRRIQSTATEYGDDEFRGCSQELLALC